MLPYVLLRWAQKRLGKGWRWGLESDGSDTVPVQGLYYTEADNVLFMPRPDATKREIRKFLHANGTHSYVAPQVGCVVGGEVYSDALHLTRTNTRKLRNSHIGNACLPPTTTTWVCELTPCNHTPSGSRGSGARPS